MGGWRPQRGGRDFAEMRPTAGLLKRLPGVGGRRGGDLAVGSAGDLGQ
jgi:hypothetical protein